MEWITNNKEIIIAICTLTAAIIALVTKYLRKRTTTNQVQNNTISQNQTQNQVVNVNVGEPKNHSNQPQVFNRASLKDSLHILFVDDEKFNMVQLLKTAGWKNVEYRKDVTNPDCRIVSWANVLFVDINGVGSKLYANQGLGLGAAIKARYPEKKVIIYSAEPTGDRFDEALRKVDGLLPKNAEPIQFSNYIEELCNE